ncbi:hypothetical protein [Clostridium hydrogenum]|uniref:hypothetical protein n=1 Tax=Clostridium hydrogenum TaxID=2855764 RepID=UPI001F224FD3|nr:hypothetical protein [Clostridium hydrogenum]
MRKRVLAILFTAVVIFSGCSAKKVVNSKVDLKKSNSTDVISKSVSDKKESTKKESIKTEALTEKNNANSQNTIRSTNLPKLSVQQKKQVQVKLDSAVRNIDEALKSLQDPSDINLN